MVRLLVMLALTAPALAASPPDELVEEIAELRKQVGEHGEVVADERDFADALRRVASDQPEWNQQQLRPETPPKPSSVQAPSRWMEDRPGYLQVSPNTFVPVDHQNRFPPFTNPTNGRPHHPAPPRNRPPRVMLREAAFQLDRIAHELEMTELFDEADALRGTANTLRKSARKPPTGLDPGPARGRGRVRAPIERDRGRESLNEGTPTLRGRLPQHTREMLRQQGEARDRFYREQARQLQPPLPPQPAEPPRPGDE